MLRILQMIAAALFLASCSSAATEPADTDIAQVARDMFTSQDGAEAHASEIAALRVEKKTCSAVAGTAWQCEFRVLPPNSDPGQWQIEFLRMDGGKWIFVQGKEREELMKPLIAERQAATAKEAADQTAEAEANKPAVVSDLPPRYDLVDPATIDILGVSIGDLRTDVLAKLPSLGPSAASSISSTVRTEKYTDELGHELAFGHTVRDTVSLGDADRQDLLEAQYTTSISGERVAQLQRTIFWHKKGPDAAEFVVSLKEKYGPPSYYEEITNNGHTFTIMYVYLDGKLATFPGEMSNDAKRCFTTATLSGGYYPSPTPRKDDAPGCTLLIYISMVASGDNLNSATIQIADWRRAYDNAVASDEFVAKKFSEFPRPPEPEAAIAPKL